ncbi:MAG: aminotransferase class III-fold pyridoxal phosphate-dependent enzyme [Desulfovibrionales bacterium]
MSPSVKRTFTTPSIRKYIAESRKSVSELSTELGLSTSTIRKWKKRAEGYDLWERSTRSRTYFTPLQEILIVEVRKLLLLSLDDLLTLVRTFIVPTCTRSSLDRLLRRHHVCRVAELVPDAEMHKDFLRKYRCYHPGFLRIHMRTLPRMQDETFRKHLFLAVDRATEWVYLEVHNHEGPEPAALFLRNLAKSAPFRIYKVLTSDNPMFFDSGSNGVHPFERSCNKLSIEHSVYSKSIHEETGGQFDFAIDSTEPMPFATAEELEKKLLSHCYIYNTHIPQRALGRRTPLEMLQLYYHSNPELFTLDPHELTTHTGQDKFLFYQSAKRQPTIARSEGIYMWDTMGKEYIDGSSGAVINNIGHGNTQVIDAIARQSQKTFFAYRTQFENEPAHQLARKLVEHSYPHLNRVFYVSGGSEAVESAMKVCRQYFFNLGEGSRYKFISRTPSYHGATLGALALTSYAPLEVAFKPMVREYPKIPAPFCYRCVYRKTYPDCEVQCAWALEKVILEQGPENVAAFVTEPVGGASTGAIVPPDEYFGIIQHICRKYGILLILDEVMTGFGRTGKLFAYEHWNVHADVVALSKGIASGYYPLGAIVTRDEIVDVVLSRGGFAHGHTYAGNPMACAVGLEVLNVILGRRLPQNAAHMGTLLLEGLARLGDKYPMIGNVRGIGLLTAMEMVRDLTTREPFPTEWNVAMLLTETAFEEGLIIYPRRSINGLFGDHVLVAPPLIVTAKQVEAILKKLDRALERTTHRITELETACVETSQNLPGRTAPYLR